MIEISGLTKKFDQFTAVDKLSFEVAEGEVLGFLGPNGAGKSTTMKIITGFISPTEGRVTVDGFDITKHPLEAKRLIGYLPEGAPSYGDMTTSEFLRFIGQVRGFSGTELQRRIDKVIDDVQLKSVSQQSIETLSKGFKRRVGLAQAIIHDPKILVLDEPTDGLDPNQKQHVRELIKSLSKDKIVIISTHILEEVSAVCTRAIIISQGKIVADGTPAELEAKSKYHHAVSVSLLTEYDLAADLKDHPAVEAVEVDAQNRLSFTIISKQGQPIFAEISTLAQQKNWPVSEFHINKGQLEDVFRNVTQQA